MMGDPVRVAYIDSSGELGGAEHLLLALIGGLPADQVTPLLICGKDGPFPAIARQRGIPTEVIPSPRFMSISLVIGARKILNPIAIVRNLFSVIRAARRLSRVLIDQRIDLVQTNTDFAHIYGGLAARMAGLPCLWYFHDLIEPKRMRGMLARIWQLLARLLATQVIGVSQAVIDALAIGTKARVIYTGLQPPASISLPDLRESLGLLADTPLIGYLGRIGYVKALDVLVSAAQQVIREQPTAHFVLFGEAMFGEQHLKKALMAAVDQNGLADRWHWMGYDPQATARLPELNMLVLPSRREALPLVLIEAGMMGIPTVASRVGGIPEIVVDQETGLLVTPGDADQLAAAIVRLLCDPPLAVELGRRAKARITALFDSVRYYDQFLEVYAPFGRHTDQQADQRRSP